MSFADTFEVPVVEKIGGESVTFPLLQIDDYIAWTTELHAERKRIDAKGIALIKDPVQKIQIMRRSEADVPDVWTIGNLIRQAPSAMRVLEMSLKKAGKSKEEKERTESLVRRHCRSDKDRHNRGRV